MWENAANLMSEIKQEIPWTHSNMNISKCKSVPLLCQQILLTYGKDESHYKKQFMSLATMNEVRLFWQKITSFSFVL